MNATNLKRGMLMITRAVIFCSLIMIVFLCPVNSLAQDPVKWSAPADHYPEQWNPTPAPPVYNPYGYSYYPYGGAYGYEGQGHNQAYSYGYGMPYQNYGGGYYYSGNPYYGR